MDNFYRGSIRKGETYTLIGGSQARVIKITCYPNEEAWVHYVNHTPNTIYHSEISGTPKMTETEFRGQVREAPEYEVEELPAYIR